MTAQQLVEIRLYKPILIKKNYISTIIKKLAKCEEAARAKGYEPI